MSFFGFDSSGAPQAQASEKVYDFQDTYEGLGELEEDDAFNSETFGVSTVGKNFDFSGTSAAAPVASASTARPNISFARAAAANDDEFMKDLWGDNTPERSGRQPQPPAPEEKRVMSLEEIEAQLTAIEKPPQSQMQQMPQQYYQGMPPQFGGYMMPQGYMPGPPGSQYGMPFPGHFMPMQAPMMPGHMQQGMPGMPGMPMQPNMNQPQLQQMPVQQSQPAPQPSVPQSAPLAPQQAQSAAPPAQTPATAPQAPTLAKTKEQAGFEKAARADLSQFPVLGSKDQGREVLQQQSQLQVNKMPLPPQSAVFAQHANRQHVSPADLLPEEQQRLARRQEKVSRIMKYCGVMNPKDKDFVTRFQLSQIVTDDPYNEDFYAQVFRVIHPKSTPNALGEPAPQQANSIAQAYLDQSGHRLGGRFKRADVALQRMQQQVQKAVTVAKERQKVSHNAREGVLGKISFGSGKKPRQQLVILSKAAQKAKDSENQEEGVPQKKSRSPSMAAPSKPIKKYSKKDIMSILEEIINNLMTVESESRLSPDVDTSRLWESLHVLDQSSSSGDDESYVNPFVQCLNYSKALKILPRLFKFLSREQILTVVTLIMANLENLKVIKNGSYTTYPEKKIPEDVQALVDTYTLTFCKILMNAVQDFKFNEIIGLLLILVQHNVVSFVSTTKIGLSVLTTLLSRAELMRGEGTISATDLSEWTSCYDELFTALESRIAAIFPPTHADTEDDYVWQFLATLSLGGKLSHQRIIVDEVRDEIFGVMSRAKAIDNADMANLYKKQTMLNNLNMYLVVMGLVADENEIQELKS